MLPPFTSLDRAGRLLVGTGIALGAQDLHFEAAGAFTGEVSAAMLSACGCRYVLVGHSERRALLREDDALVNRKLRRAVAAGLVPILCVGETLAERRGGETERRIAAQLAAALDGVESRDVRPLIIAYEPVWAIGTGEAASPAAAAGGDGADPRGGRRPLTGRRLARACGSCTGEASRRRTSRPSSTSPTSTEPSSAGPPSARRARPNRRRGLVRARLTGSRRKEYVRREGERC